MIKESMSYLFTVMISACVCALNQQIIVSNLLTFKHGSTVRILIKTGMLDDIQTEVNYYAVKCIRNKKIEYYIKIFSKFGQIIMISFQDTRKK